MPQKSEKVTVRVGKLKFSKIQYFIKREISWLEVENRFTMENMEKLH